MVAQDPRFPSSSTDSPTKTTTNPWDTAQVAGSSADPVSIFDGQNQPSDPSQPNSSLTQQLNRNFGASTAHHIKLNTLDPYQLPVGLSPTQLQRFLIDASRVLDNKGQLIGDQKLTVPTRDSPRGMPVTTSSDPLYDGNDAEFVLDPTKFAALVASAAEQLAELDPAGNLAGTRRDLVLEQLGEGADGTISPVSIVQRKAQYDLQELLGKSLAVADKLSQQENATEEATTATIPTDVSESQVAKDTESSEDDSLGSTFESFADAEGGGEGSAAEAAVEPVVEPALEPQPEEVVIPPTEQQPPEPKEVLPQEQTQPEVPPAQTTQQQTTQTPTAPAPLSHPQTSDPELIALLTEKFSHDYVGAFVAPGDIPPDLTTELQTQITALLEQNYSPYELEKLRYSPTLYSKAVKQLHNSLKSSSVQTKTQAFLTSFAESANATPEQKQYIQNALQTGTFLQVSDATNPYHDFVQQAAQIVGAQNAGALFVANLATSQSSLEASILAIGHDRTQKLLETASPEQLRLLLNIPSNTTLSATQLEQLRFSIVAIVPTMTARLVYDAQAPVLREGLFKQPKTAGVESVRQSGGLRPTISPDEQEAIENIKEIGPGAGKSMSQTPRGTKKQLDRIQKMLQGSWDSLDRELQEYIYRENDLTIPPNTHPQDHLPYTTAFIQYSQKDLDAQKRWLELAGARDLHRQQAAQEAFKISQEYVEAQKELIIAAHMGQKMREEYLEALRLTAAYATHANALAMIQENGELGAPETVYLSSEDMGLAQLSPENDFNSYLELMQSSEYLTENPEVYGQYAGAAAGNQGLMGRLRQPFARGARMPSRLKAMKSSLAKTAKTAKELRGLAVNAAQAIAGNPAAIAKLGLDLFRTSTGRKILAVGAGASLLPMLPGLAALLNAANWWNRATGAVNSAVSAVSGGGGAAAGSGSSAAAASGTAAATPQSALATQIAEAGNKTTLAPAGQGVAVQTAGFNIFASFSGTVFASMFGFVVFSIFMVLMVINGAFLIPTPTSSVADPTKVNPPSQSLYLSLEKKVLEKKFENDVDSVARYTVTITPKSPYSIGLVSVTDTYSFFGEGDRTQLQTLVSPVTKEDFPLEKFTTPAEKKYTVTMRGTDTLVTNTFTLKYNVYDAGGTLVKADQTLSSSASVVIGEVKGGCFVFMEAGIRIPNGPITSAWTEAEKLLVMQAYAKRVGNNPQFISLLCSAGPVKLARLAGKSYGGWAFPGENTLGLYDNILKTIPPAEYTLVHEFGHIIANRNSSLLTAFKTVLTNTECFTYPIQNDKDPNSCNYDHPRWGKVNFLSESFAEAVALGAIYKTYRFTGGIYDFPTREPDEYAWIRDNIYGGVEF